ncbi:MAG: hypothetical protein A3F22_00880 [Candidatus Magasanikbacteria bacterium RIFCSPHIGHO2_12_FULL_41_16]|nr:MAG: hypothetical protein A3C66_03095 [Candidatus Magasanikbacteria bacterium RIFCSPHIGHO2_02_FULL_41_35]OGH74772.1 MAG: hypothetical protein A3F22_00880 [Candidatus Magasanikbacteria bacterium RIFCSPHIGHO2_12_FULL_41_16]
MFNDLHHHRIFYQTKALNGLYFSIFIMNLAESMISIFVPIYLYTHGYSLAHVILFFLISNIASVLGAIPAAHLVTKIGPRLAILFSTPFLILYYFGLPIITSFPILFFLLPIILAGRVLLYNFGFDLNFIAHADRQNLGSELSYIAIVGMAAGIAAPFLAGFIILFFTYQTLFLIGSFLLVLSVIPLFFSSSPNQNVSFKSKKVFQLAQTKTIFPVLLSFGGYAIESSIGRIVWPIFLIIIVGTTNKVGSIVTVSALLTVFVIAVVGKLTDRLKPSHLLQWGTALYFLGWLGSVLATTTATVFLADSYRKIIERFILLPWSASFYRLTLNSVYFESVVLRDMVFNGSRVLVLPFLMMVSVFSSHPYAIMFIIASFGTLFYPLIIRRQVLA